MLIYQQILRKTLNREYPSTYSLKLETSDHATY